MQRSQAARLTFTLAGVRGSQPAQIEFTSWTAISMTTKWSVASCFFFTERKQTGGRTGCRVTFAVQPPVVSTFPESTAASVFGRHFPASHVRLLRLRACVSVWPGCDPSCLCALSQTGGKCSDIVHCAEKPAPQWLRDTEVGSPY